MANRKTAPSTSLPTSLQLPAQQLIATSGVKLYSLQASGAQVVRLTLVFAGGSSVQSVPYCAASMLSMLSEGSVGITAAQVAEKLDFYGIFYDSGTDRDFCTITVACLTKFLPQTLEILESILLHPVFGQKEFDIHIAKKRENLVAEREKPSYIARETFAKELFGEHHPYGRFYPTDNLNKLTVENLKQYHAQYIVSNRLFAVCSGDIGGEQIDAINDFLAKIPAAAAVADLEFAEPKSSSKTVTVNRPSSAAAVQSSIRIGKISITKSHSDYIPLQLLLMVLGGYFSSRLMLNLREDKGYTYGVGASMISLSKAGYIAIATDVALQSQDDAIAQIEAEIERLKTELIPTDELQMAKNTITGELMRLLDGPFGIADIAIENICCDLPQSYLNDFLAQITAVTPPQLQTIAKTYLGDFTTVIVH